MYKQLKSAVSNNSTNHSAPSTNVRNKKGNQCAAAMLVSPKRNNAMSVIFDGKWSKEDLIWGTRDSLSSDEVFILCHAHYVTCKTTRTSETDVYVYNTAERVSAQ